MGSTRKLDVLVLLADLHKQATVERSHYYVGKVVSLAIDEIGSLRAALKSLEARPTVRRKPPVQQAMVRICPSCDGEGRIRRYEPGGEWYRCDKCSGTGKRQTVAQPLYAMFAHEKRQKNYGNKKNRIRMY